MRPLGLRIQEINSTKSQPSKKVHWYKYEALIREYHDYINCQNIVELPLNEERLSLLGKLEGISIMQAMWILDTLHKTLNLEGDICEFGVAAGRTSALMANEILNTEKNLWLFDSFEGLPRPTKNDELIDDVLGLGAMSAYEGEMKFSKESVISNLSEICFPYSRVNIVPGYIEDTIHSVNLPDKVCFAFLDFDFYEPIRLALEFLAEHLVSGGHIVVDDYGYFSTGAKTAVDEFIASHSFSFDMLLPPSWAGHFAILKRS